MCIQGRVYNSFVKVFIEWRGVIVYISGVVAGVFY